MSDLTYIFHTQPELCMDTSYEGLLRRLPLNDDIIQIHTLLKLAANDCYIPEEVWVLAFQHAKVSPALKIALLQYADRWGFLDYLNTLHNLEDKGSSLIACSQRLHDALVQGDRANVVRSLAFASISTGGTTFLCDAANQAFKHLSFTSVIPIFLRLIYIESPPHTQRFFQIIQILRREGESDLLIKYAHTLQRLAGTEGVVSYASACASLLRDEPKKTLAALAGIDVSQSSKEVAAEIKNVTASAHEKLGQYKKAASLYQSQNDVLSNKKQALWKTCKSIDNRAELSISTTECCENDHLIIMTGFPRSGTTLLENVFASHREVNTVEESSAFGLAFRAILGQFEEYKDLNAESGIIELGRKTRERYLALLNKERNAEAPVLIDKTPIQSAEVRFVEKILPGQRYIFSLRHPYDVVLSNWKQSYNQNMYMAAFNKMGDASEFYDYVMRNWFDVFPEETDRVCYVYYDELVTDFEPTIRRVIDFLGVEWDDAVLDFAEHSKKRAVRTPSYANVRKGLSLGVQSSYQNYLFLFDDYCRSKLDPWVEFFGYTVEDPKI